MAALCYHIPMRYRTRLADSQSTRFAKRKKVRGVLVALFAAAALVGWTISLSELSYLPELNIENIRVEGAGPSTAASIESQARRQLSEPFFRIFSGANAFLFSKDKLAAAAEAVSPDIQSVTVSRSGLTSLDISVSGKKAQALVCPGLPDFAEDGSLDLSAGSCFEADAGGFIFAAATTTDLGLNLYFLQQAADSSTTPLVGTSTMPTDQFEDIQNFYEGVRRAGLEPIGVLVKDGGEYEMYLKNQGSGQGSAGGEEALTVVYFNDKRALADELSNLISFLGGMKGPFEYVDVRYGSNVFYRPAR